MSHLAFFGLMVTVLTGSNVTMTMTVVVTVTVTFIICFLLSALSVVPTVFVSCSNMPKRWTDNCPHDGECKSHAACRQRRSGEAKHSKRVSAATAATAAALTAVVLTVAGTIASAVQPMLPGTAAKPAALAAAQDTGAKQSPVPSKQYICSKQYAYSSKETMHPVRQLQWLVAARPYA